MTEKFQPDMAIFGPIRPSLRLLQIPSIWERFEEDGAGRSKVSKTERLKSVSSVKRIWALTIFIMDCIQHWSAKKTLWKRRKSGWTENQQRRFGKNISWWILFPVCSSARYVASESVEQPWQQQEIMLRAFAAPIQGTVIIAAHTLMWWRRRLLEHWKAGWRDIRLKSIRSVIRTISRLPENSWWKSNRSLKSYPNSWKIPLTW